MTDESVIHRGRKFAQVSEAAAAVFLRDGFAASVDDIARAARVSKATLYSYYPDKKLMFRDVLEQATETAFRQLPPLAPAGDAAAAEDLLLWLRRLAQWMKAPAVLDLHRVLMAEATRVPDSARAFRKRLETDIATPLARQIETIAGQASPAADGPRIAQLILDLLAGGVLVRALMATESPTPQQLDQTLAAAAALLPVQGVAAMR